MRAGGAGGAEGMRGSALGPPHAAPCPSGSVPLPSGDRGCRGCVARGSLTTFRKLCGVFLLFLFWDAALCLSLRIPFLLCSLAPSALLFLLASVLSCLPEASEKQFAVCILRG